MAPPPDYTHLLAFDVSKVREDRWYCGVCGTDRNDEGSIRAHLNNLCDEPESERCVHYFNHAEFLHLIFNLKKRAEEAAQRFALQLSTIGNVDDFLVDCGDQPWPAMEADE